MSERYQVIYSTHVRNELKRLITSLESKETRTEVRDSLIELDKRLSIYPQFGEPLLDLHLDSAQIWIGVIPPLVAKYVIYENQRQVWVVAPLLMIDRPTT